MDFTAKPFDQAWTLQDTQAYFDWLYDNDKVATHLTSEVDEKLRQAVVGHLMHLQDIGQLPAIDHAQNLSLPFSNGWKRVLEGRYGEKFWDRGDNFKIDRALAQWFYRSKEDPIEEIHQKLLDAMKQGNFGHYALGDAQECALTGAKLFTQIKNWKPILGTLQPKVGGQWFEQEFVPIQADQFTAPGIEHVEIPVPTSELLIHDWFRIPAFTKATKEVDEQSDTSDDFSASGRARNTRAYAEQLGFASVFGGGDPAVIFDGPTLCIGHIDPDGRMAQQHYKDNIGNVSSQLRACTLIDRQVLIDIIAKTEGVEAATSQVQRLLQEESSIIRVSVKPGTYHLYCAGSRQIFEEKFSSKEVSMKGFEDPMLVLSPNALTLEHAQPSRKSKGPR